jgi:signal peptidase II
MAESVKRDALNKRLFWVVIVVCLIMDQVIKAWVRENLLLGQSWRGGPWHGVFEITLSYNKGIAFGMMQGSQLLMTPIALFIAGMAVRAVYKNRDETRWSTFALALLVSGAIGNLIDRLVNKNGVTDMFLVRLANISGGRLNDFPVFNLADSCITIAMIMLLITWSKNNEPKEVAVLEKNITPVSEDGGDVVETTS